MKSYCLSFEALNQLIHLCIDFCSILVQVANKMLSLLLRLSFRRRKSRRGRERKRSQRATAAVAVIVNANPRRGAMTTLTTERTKRRRNTKNTNHTSRADTAHTTVEVYSDLLSCSKTKTFKKKTACNAKII